MPPARQNAGAGAVRHSHTDPPRRLNPAVRPAPGE